jgi:hypothetical protein
MRKQDGLHLLERRLKLAVDKYFMDFRYWDTDISKSQLGGSAAAESRFVFSAGVTLP